MRVLLYQPNHTGHHYVYLAHMLRGFRELPVEVIVATTPQGVQSDEFNKTLAKYKGRVRFETCCTTPPEPMYQNARHRLREFIGSVRAINPDVAGLMYADGIWPLLAMRWLTGRWPFPKNVFVEAWLYRGGFVYGDARGFAATAKRMLFDRLVSRGPFARLHLDDELLYDHARRAARPQSRTELMLTPNPIEIRPLIALKEARARMNLPEGARLLCALGLIDVRKGVDLLIRGFEQLAAKERFADVRLLLGGPHHEVIKRMLDEDELRRLVDSGRIICFDRFLTTQEMYDSAAASDLVTATYPAHSGRSSIILWAAAAGRPCLGAARGCIGHVIQHENLGSVCSDLAPQPLAQALGEALEKPWDDEDVKRVRTYAEYHTAENYASIGAGLTRRLAHERSTDS